ncbi:MAG TPA: GNAT family N-acetyltransferase, partial [Patescibacteria group bacterium]
KRSYHIGIFGITIAKDYREIGIGEVLSRTIIEESKKQIPGLKILSLNVFSPNLRAQSLYKKLGFTQYALLPKGVYYKGDYVDEIKMFLPL